jgi:hypothetical protein
VTVESAAPSRQARARSGLSVLALAASIAILALAVPGALLFTIPDVGRSQGWVVTILIAVYGGVRLSVLWVSGVPRLFDFFVWLYTYVFIGIAATVQMRSGEVAETTPGMNAALDLPTAYVVLLGLAAYEVSRLVWFALHRKAPTRQLRPAQVSGARSVLLFGLGLAFAAYYLYRLGWQIIITDRYTASDMEGQAWAEPATRAIVNALAVYPLLVATGALAQVRQRAQQGLGRMAWTGLLWLGILALLMVASPISSARYTFGTVAFAIACYLGVTRTQARARAAMGGMILAMIFLFPIADAFRSSTVSFARSSFFGEYAGNADYDSFWQIANAYSYSQAGFVEPFRQLLGSLLFWVPRVLWADKPTDTGILLADYRGYSFTNLSAPIWAEFLVNGGILLVVVGFCVLGPLLASLDRRMAPAHHQGGWWALVGAILPVYMVILMRGSLLQATGALFVAIGCLVFVRTGTRQRSGPQAALRSPPY